MHWSSGAQRDNIILLFRSDPINLYTVWSLFKQPKPVWPCSGETGGGGGGGFQNPQCIILWGNSLWSQVKSVAHLFCNFSYLQTFHTFRSVLSNLSSISKSCPYLRGKLKAKDAMLCVILIMTVHSQWHSTRHMLSVACGDNYIQ